MKLSKSQAGFLVVLRLVCGSHFFYQGMIKLADRSWSSYSYLMNSEWVLGGAFRWMAETKAVLAVVDIVNVWGLILIGLALILGVFGRIASLCGFLLLSLYYLANPPFAVMGASPVGGEYSFIVNKLLIEMAAFAVLFLFPTDTAFGLGKIRELVFRKRAGGEETDSGKKLSRREILSTLGGLPVLGVFTYPFVKGLRKKLDAISGATTLALPDSYKQEYARLKTMNLNDASVAAKQKDMPVGRIGNLTMGRVISGSNLISMNMHARDLDYVSALATNYNTEERIFMTLKKCEEYGINAIVLKDHNFEQFRLRKYWDEWGGKMVWIADVITTDIDKYEELLVKHLELGASAAYLWGGASDIWYYEKKQDNIIKAFEIMKKYNIPVGIGAHRLEPIMFCEKEGLAPDFYFKTFHHDRYWSAHPKGNRKYMEMWVEWSNKYGEFHDNLWCDGHEETVAFMQDVKVPWIAFKVLAAGAIGVEEGLKYAFENGADFICLGMFDFQVKEDAEIAQRVIAGTKNRKRPWMG